MTQPVTRNPAKPTVAAAPRAAVDDPSAKTAKTVTKKATAPAETKKAAAAK